MARKKEVALSYLRSSKITIAICQLETDGKHKTLVGDRNSFGWKNIEDVNERVRKAGEIVDSLNRLPKQQIDIIVFPEYSLPIEKVVPLLQQKSHQYGQIIVAGADNIVQEDSSRILNQCPIILPNKKIVWVTKRQLSPWEHGYVDEPENFQVPKLTWKDADGNKYWMAVSICLDFNLAKKEYSKGGGIFIVPMCSPDVDAFRGWADDLMRLEHGTATVLCNGFGELGAGQSSLIAMIPDGKPFKPAFELPESKEAIAVFEIDCKQLAPPKKTNPAFTYPLGKTFFYSLISTSGRIELKTLQIIEKDVVTRGVINPAIFENLDKKTRMAFLSVENFWESVRGLRHQNFEVLAILGQHDILITHIHENRYDMIYDIRKVINWRMSP